MLMIAAMISSSLSDAGFEKEPSARSERGRRRKGTHLLRCGAHDIDRLGEVLEVIDKLVTDLDLEVVGQEFQEACEACSPWSAEPGTHQGGNAPWRDATESFLWSARFIKTGFSPVWRRSFGSFPCAIMTCLRLWYEASTTSGALAYRSLKKTESALSRVAECFGSCL